MTIGTDTLFTANFVAANGTALPSPWVYLSGSWNIQSNAAQPVSGSSPYSAHVSPSRANDNYKVTMVVPGYPGQSRPVEGIMVRRSNGTGTTNTGYILGMDDGNNAFIWTVVNDVATPLTLSSGGGFQGGNWDGTLIALVDGSSLTLTNGGGTTLAAVTDTTYTSGDVGMYVAGTGPSFSSFNVVGTASGTPGNATGAGATQNATAPTGSAAVTGVFPGYANILRDTDTGVPLANATGLILSYRTNSNDGTVAWSTTTGTTDATGKVIAETGLAGSTGSMGAVGSTGYLTIENSAKTIVATYKITIVDLGS